MKLSVVSTLYNSRPYLEEFLSKLMGAINILKIGDFEIIFVNDGSPDNSMDFLLSKKSEISEIKIINLSRNFGHHNAMQAGLKFSEGDYIFLIDNDLETSPHFLIECFKKINDNKEYDVVYGFQEERKGKFIESVGGSLFWWLINKFSEVKIPKNILTERLMTRNYLNSLLQLGDANLFLGGMMYWTGYSQIGIPVKKSLRTGNNTYSTRKRFDLMIQAVTSFTGKPLEYLFYLGLLITFGSLIFIIYLIFQKLIMGDSVQLGWTSIIAINILSLGIISSFLGLIGLYIFKVFRQSQNRPNFIVENIY